MEHTKFYIGSLTQCNNYNNKVVAGEESKGKGFYNGDTWASPIKHPSQDLYRIQKHSDYSHSTMLLVNEDDLDASWFVRPE